MWSKLKELFKFLLPVEKKVVPKEIKFSIETTPPDTESPFHRMWVEAEAMRPVDIETGRNLRGTVHRTPIDFDLPLDVFPVYHYDIGDVVKPQ